MTKNKKPYAGYPLWRRWTHIRACYTNPNYKDYDYVHELGLECDWTNFHDFNDAIMRHLGPPPSSRHKLNRVNPNRGWHLDNLRWALQETVGQTQRHCLRTRIQGETKTIKQISKEYSVSYWVLRSAYHRGLRGRKLLEAALAKKV